MKKNYLVSCSVAALLCSGVGAIADEATPSSGVETVVVTAERRTENIQKVPMTVQALTGEQLKELNALTVNDLLRYTPNVTVGSNGPGQGEIYMRGLSNGFRGDQSTGTVGNFPNVAIYLDEQSMQFPARNVDIYMVDMNRIEVLEGPQGALFGGGAEAGALRYITNKPKLDTFEATASAMYGATQHGDTNDGFNVVMNVPLVDDKLAVRVVIYNERQGGYIDNVPSTFTRSNSDLGNFYWGITPTGGVCPNGNPAGAAGLCAPPGVQANNYNVVKKNQNPTTYEGIRASALYQIDNDWDVLVSESLQNLDAEGLSVEYPFSSEINPNNTLQPLKPLQVTAFNPSWEKDTFSNTSWTVNGKIGDIKAIYTGGWMVRHINQQMEYSNYSRWYNGQYYECVGGTTGWSGAPFCYSPSVYWDDQVRNTHMSHEVRFSTPDDWRLRAIAGAYYEDFKIYDDQNFNYKTIPSCTPANLAIASMGGPICAGFVEPKPGTTANDPSVRGAMTAFGEDTQRGYSQLAFFGSADYDIIPNTLTVSLGTRWYQYRETEVGSEYITNNGAGGCQNVPLCSDWVDINAAHDKKTYAGFKSRASLQWNIDDDTMVYYLFSQGFRPGGFNRGANHGVAGLTGKKSEYQYQQPDSYRPDQLVNHEIGLKKGLFDGNLQLSVSAYYMRWENEQYILFFPAFLGNTTFSVNGPTFDIKGLEAQYVARVFDGFTSQGSFSYNDNTQANAPCLISNLMSSPTFGQCITQAYTKSGVLSPFTNPFGVKGAQAPFSPKWQANIRGRYEWTIGDYLAHAQAGATYTGGMWNQPANYESGTGVLIPPTTYLRYFQPGYVTFDASIGVQKDRWTAELFGENLSDSRASTFTSSAQFIKSEVPLRPRVVGIKVGFSY